MEVKEFHHQKDFTVHSFQINPQGNLRWSALADILQEIAWLHANSEDFGKNLFEDDLMWVLSRFEIHCLKKPVWGERITVKTAGRGIHKLFALREFQVLDQAGTILVEAMSAWLLLDVKSKRPRKPEAVLPKRHFKPLLGDELVPSKVIVPEDLEFAYAIQVTPSDLDMNRHVNNASYIRWVEDFCWRKEIKIDHLLIQYLEEVKLDEEVQLYFEKRGGHWNIVGKSVNGRAVFSAMTKV
ncbi:acyl-[acyl-carrier-protein] thioesterase [Pararhodonellum marinum]|uniref:acyl-[acyl-carrier-protein] thioesterase n=1 Tax=Pararhodonellum marinum TaxID=2755358 RepID=UPI00189005FD|nr:acyl-ACP thioesterase domain-containing protein [Pararhodonellum marinum]